MDAPRTHSVVIADGMVHHNPYYVEPGSFAAGGGERLALRISVMNLQCLADV